MILRRLALLALVSLLLGSGTGCVALGALPLLDRDKDNTPTPVVTLTPGATPTALPNGLPASVSNGNDWLPDASYEDITKNIVSVVNQEFPDSDIKAQSYGDPDGDGMVLLLVAQHEIDSDTVMQIFSTTSRQAQPGTYTHCGEKTETGDERIGCVTETDPSVMALFFGEHDEWTPNTLAKLVAEYQATL